MSEEPIDAEIVPAAPAARRPAGPAPVPPPPDYDDRGVPSLDHVRDTIEDRYATSLGSRELSDDTSQARSLAEQEEERARAATERLAEIRRSLPGGC